MEDIERFSRSFWRMSRKRRIRDQVKIELDPSFYRKLSRELFPLRPTLIHQNKRRYNRKKKKEKWKREVREALRDF